MIETLTPISALGRCDLLEVKTGTAYGAGRLAMSLTDKKTARTFGQIFARG